MVEWPCFAFADGSVAAAAGLNAMTEADAWVVGRDESIASYSVAAFAAEEEQ